MCNFFESQCLVMLSYDCFVEILRIETNPQLTIGFFRVCQQADPWCRFHLFRYNSLLDHLVQLFFDLYFVLDWHLTSSVLHWWYTGVGFDVVSAGHVTYAIKRVGKQGLQVPGAINLNATWLHVYQVEPGRF